MLVKNSLQLLLLVTFALIRTVSHWTPLLRTWLMVAMAVLFRRYTTGVKKSRAPGRLGSYVLCDGAKYCRRNRCSFFPPLRHTECVAGDTPSIKRQITGSPVTPELWVFIMELASCHTFDTQNLEVVPRSMDYLWTLELPFFWS